MRTTVSIVLILLVALGIAACAPTASEPTAVPETAVMEEVEVAQADPTEPPAATEVVIEEPTDEPTEVPTVAPTDTPEPAIVLPDLGVAPEITNEVWINSEPLTLEALQGKVVLVEFWTYS